MTWVEKWAGKNKAKTNNFRQHVSPPENLFELNFVLEAADLRVAIQDSPSDRCSVYTSTGNSRRHRTVAFSLAKVVDKQGPRLCLRHLGTDDRNDIWLMIDSDMIRPYPSGSELSVPFGFMNSHSVWNKMVMKVDKEEKLAPKDWFPQHPKDPGSNIFKVGEKLEAVDRRNAQLICPATISEIKRNFVLVSFDGWSGTFDYWALYNSQDLFPVGWCSKARHKLQQPGPYYEIVGKSRSEYTEEYSAPAHAQKTLKRRETISITTKRKSCKPIEKPIIISQEKSLLPSPDYDSDCTHLCINDDDFRTKKRKLSSSSSNHDISEISKFDVEFKSKSKAFRNLFKMWTEKTALQTKKVNKEENENEEIRVNKEEMEEKLSISSMKEEAAIDSLSKKYTAALSEKLSDSTSDVVLSPNDTPSQPTSKKPPSPSATNSITEDYKYLSDTSGISCCGKSDEMSSLILSPSDVSKGVSCASSLPSDPCQWTIEDVQSYLIGKNPSLEAVAHEFRNHEIDGQAFLLLTMNTLRQYMKIKLGPAIKVENIIRNVLEGKI